MTRTEGNDPSGAGTPRFRVGRRNPHRISAYEAVCYTALLLLAAAVAFGWFDLMIPWGS
jgi:hypothetical protein